LPFFTARDFCVGASFAKFGRSRAVASILPSFGPELAFRVWLVQAQLAQGSSFSAKVLG